MFYIIIGKKALQLYIAELKCYIRRICKKVTIFLGNSHTLSDRFFPLDGL